MASAPAQATGALRAARVTEANAAELLVRGPHAIGGIGDWALQNGTLCAVVTDPGHESILSPQGGVLVDLGHCGQADDEFNVLQPVFNISRGSVPPVDEVEAAVRDGEARVVTRGSSRGVVFETAYVLDEKHPDALRIRSTLRRIADGGQVSIFGDVLIHGNGSLSPFALSRSYPERSPGFVHPAVDVADPLAMLRAIVPADVHVAVGANTAEPGISYGLRLDSARLESADPARSAHSADRAEPLASVAINGEHFTTLAIFTRPFWYAGAGPPGWLQFLQGFLMDLHEGESLVYERTLVVGRRADVASVTDAIWPDAPRITGRVDDASARLHVMRSDGAPLTEVRPSPDGRFAFRAPPGVYELRIRAPGGRERTRPLTVSAADLDLGTLETGRPARVRLPSGRSMRLIFRGTGGTPDPPLGDDLRGFAVGGEAIVPSAFSREVSLAGRPGDPEVVVLPPGSYRVFATRGPEYGLRQVALRAVAGETAVLEIEPPERVLTTPGWLSADFHVHSGASDDSSLALRSRVASFAAQGSEVLVSTDHDMVTDYAPLVRSLGLAGEIASVVGVEVSSTSVSDAVPYTFGHVNVFPFVRRPHEYRAGAPAHEGVRLHRFLSTVRGVASPPLVQLNHPRGHRAGDDGYEYLFTHLSVSGEPLAPARPLDAEPNRALIERDPETGLRDLD
ncbi:MAG: hypothetical protein O7A09_15005, partial [Proteobacteria bacterium]|nr:hypothetical protein [Pseudomonadota bacterium]